MKSSTLKNLATLLQVLRANSALQEVRPGTFHLNGRNFLHFHEDPEGIFADVLLTKGRVQMPVSSPAEQGELLERIDKVLKSLELRERNREQNGWRRRGPHDR